MPPEPSPTSPRPLRAVALAALLALLVAALAGCGDDDSPDSEPPAEEGAERPAGEKPSAERDRPTEPTDVADGLGVPWGIGFLPRGDALIAERDSGRLLRLDPATGETEEVQTIDVEAAGEGGLLGIAVSPDYEDDRFVYAYYTTPEDNRIARFRLGEEPEPIVTGIAAAPIHDGGRIAFGPDGMLYAGTGDAGQESLAQDPGSLNGKILRMTPAGKPPRDNPFENSLVYSIGHRNVQGLAWDEDERLYATEFGADDTDEVNLIERASNYGWPDVEGEGGEPDYVDPIATWDPSEASPAGAVIVGPDGGEWAGDMLVAALRGERLWRLELRPNGRVAERESLLDGELGRLRTVLETPDGEIWLATSNRDGRGSPAPEDDRIVSLGR
jgi:glucose/arabinose dehydrogenase